jgi:sodium transport system ATP-binding protein
MVVTTSLSKRFIDSKGRPVTAVNGVSFTAMPGQVFGLLGVNGAGKTTLLRMLSTVLRPTSGKAEVAGFDTVESSASVRESIGFMSSTTALYGRLTPKEMLEYYGGLYGLSGSLLQERYDWVVEKINIRDFSDRLCDKLSTGQKQRVSIARTILHDPPVLFLDEPTAGLDVVTSQTVMEFIEESKQIGKTIVFSTHIMSEAERLCDQIAVIHEGEVKGEGTVQDLVALTGAHSLEKAFLALVAPKEGVA